MDKLTEEYNFKMQYHVQPPPTAKDYPIRIQRSLRNLFEIRQWCINEDVDCVRIGYLYCFKNESDCVRFMLRWHE